MFDIDKFENPYYLWLLLIVPIIIAYYIWRGASGDKAKVRISSIGVLASNIYARTWRYYAQMVVLPLLRILSIALLIVAIARPQSISSGESTNVEGIDIAMALDISGSMLARDFNPNRLEAAKNITSQFIIDRPNDRVALVVFAGEAFTQSPLTTDKATLVNLLTGIQSGMITDGTAIGNGLATAINRLKDSQSPSKVIVLLTDGVNNSGQIDPMTAAQIAADYGIRVYTIGVGTEGVAPYPAYDMFGNMIYQNAKVEIDEKMLREISDLTGGEYFRATDNKSLSQIYEQINDMEKAIVEVDSYTSYKQLFAPFVLLALLLLLFEFLLRYLVIRRLP